MYTTVAKYLLETRAVDETRPNNTTVCYSLYS